MSNSTNRPSGDDPDPPGYAADIVKTLREPLVVLDGQLRVKEASAAFYRVFGVKPDETVGRLIHELGDGQWDIPALREKLDDLLQNGHSSFDDFEVDHDFPGVGQRTMLLNARRIPETGETKLILLAIDDISARRKSERRLAEQARLLDLSNDAILVRDVNNRITYWNRGAEQIFGYTRDEAIGQDLHTLLKTEFHHPFEGLIAELRKKHRMIGEVIQYAKDGRRVVLLCRWSLDHDVQGNPASILTTGTDVTQRQAAEELRTSELRTSEERFRLIVSIITDVSWTTDDQGAFVVPQLAWEKFTGQSWEEHRGFGWANALHPEDRERVKEIWEAAYRTRSLYESRGRLWHAPLQQYRHFVARAAPLFDANGDVRAWVGACTDSHDSEALRESEERFRTAIGAVSGIIWTNNGEGKMEGEQPGWDAFTGQSREEYQGYGWSKAVHPEDAQPTIEAWARAVAEKRTFVFEHRVRRHDDEWRVCSIRAVPILNAERTIREWVGVHTDITEQVAIQEELLRAKQAAEAANGAKDVFLATLSHELRTPLNAILGWTTLLQGKGVSADDLDEGLEVIRSNGKAQAKLIDDIMDVSSIVSGKLRLNITQCDLPAAIRAAMDVVRPAADAKGIALVAELDPDAREGACDPGRMQQVASNLLTNAVKFTPRGGTVRVTLSRERSTTRIVVSDTGRGISPEFMPHVFERFRQADGSTTRKVGGLGLGLSICKHIVELHGGTIRAESTGENPPSGSTFTVELPVSAVRIIAGREDGEETGEDQPHRAAAPDAGRAGGPRQLPAGRLAGLRMLIVDDEPYARIVLAKLLKRDGAIVTTAASVNEALNVIGTPGALPDLLVSDIGMPERDGYDLIRSVRAAGHRVERLPAVALTAYASREDERRALLAGFQVHMSKPVDTNELVEVAASLAGRGKA